MLFESDEGGEDMYLSDSVSEATPPASPHLTMGGDDSEGTSESMVTEPGDNSPGSSG